MNRTTRRARGCLAGLLLVAAGCASEETARHAHVSEPVVPTETEREGWVEATSEEPCSFEEDYRRRCDEQGHTGVAAKSFTDVLESMCEIVGAK